MTFKGTSVQGLALFLAAFLLMPVLGHAQNPILHSAGVLRVTLTIPERATLVEYAVSMADNKFCLQTNSRMPVRAVAVGDARTKQKNLTANTLCEDGTRKVFIDQGDVSVRDGRMVQIVALEPQ